MEPSNHFSPKSNFFFLEIIVMIIILNKIKIIIEYIIISTLMSNSRFIEIYMSRMMGFSITLVFNFQINLRELDFLEKCGGMSEGGGCPLLALDGFAYYNVSFGYITDVFARIIYVLTITSRTLNIILRPSSFYTNTRCAPSL